MYAEVAWGAGLKTPEGKAACLSLLQGVGEGYRLLSMYQCRVSAPHIPKPLVLQCQTYHVSSKGNLLLAVLEWQDNLP